jgi:hypothetical protein
VTLLAPVTLKRYRCTFPSTQEARNFWEAIGYVSRKEPVEGRNIGTSFDGRTVIIYARPEQWDRKSLNREARIRGGRVASAANVYTR